MKRLILTCMCVVTMFMCVSVARAALSTTGTFATEIVSMSLSGDCPTYGHVEIHGLPSPGIAEMTEDISGGLYHIDSFFDVFRRAAEIKLPPLVVSAAGW